MGTTIMAVKYHGGVIACADSSTLHLMQGRPLGEYMQSIEWLIR